MTDDLAQDERVLWQGAPVSGLQFRPQDLFAVPLVLLWFIGVSWVLFRPPSGQEVNVDPSTYVICFMFMLIGLYLLVGRFYLDVLNRKKTQYMLTDKRAVISSGVFRRSVESISLVAASQIVYREGARGRATIEFGAASMFGMLPRSWPGAARYLPPAFDLIEEGRRVYEMVLAAQREAQRAR
jgi:hypothetical protein